jgi:hypothetical protein
VCVCDDDDDDKLNINLFTLQENIVIIKKI